METLYLCKPNPSYREEIAAYRRDMLEAGSSMDGCSGLERFEDPGEWIHWCRQMEQEETVPDGMVPSTTLLCVRGRDRRVVGMIDIRHRLNDYLARIGGHIGYSVRPGERRKGYASEMLSRALAYCGCLGISRAMISCDQDNEGSRRTILKNGGVLQDTVMEEESGVLVQRYWIDLQHLEEKQP